MASAKTKRAAIYCRISQDREGAGLGVERQRKDCEKLARQLGYTVAATHTDNDLSAYSGKPRPGYRALLANLDAGRIDAVIVWHTDRLHRSPRELEEYITTCERRNVTTQTVQSGELDLATPSGRAVARTLGAWARYEGEHKSERIKAAQLQAAQAGRWLGGAPPLGWNVRDDGSATLDREAARRIRKASTDVLAGASTGSIVTAWNTAGFTTSTGRAWSYATLRQVLTRARNAKLIRFNGEIVGESTWPGIVTEDVWRAVCAVFADPSRRRSQSNRARWLLSGIALCGKDGCGAALKSATASSSGGNRTVYRCTQPGNGHVARSAVRVDELVRAVVAARLGQPDVRDLLPAAARERSGAGEARAEAAALRVRLTEAAGMFAAGTISSAQLGRITADVNRQVKAAEADMDAQARRSSLSGVANAADPAAAWQRAPVDRQRAVVRELLTVTVLPGLRGRGFDPALVRIDWRTP